MLIMNQFLIKQHIEAKFRSDKGQTGNRNTADNFVPLNTADFKAQTSHTIGFEITATS